MHWFARVPYDGEHDAREQIESLPLYRAGCGPARVELAPLTHDPARRPSPALVNLAHLED